MTQVDLWYVKLDLPAVETLLNVLTSEEKAKADRFYAPKQQRRFVVARGTLRMVLSQYLNTVSQKVAFEYSPKGKPSLVQRKDLFFNVSHSEDLAIYGVSFHRRIGVDIEYLRPLPNALQLAQRFFCETEYQLLASTSQSDQAKEFFRLWTAKEAVLKAIGEGISGGLDQFAITAEPCQLVKSREGNLYSLAAFSWDEHYLGAIALEHPDAFTWQTINAQALLEG